MESIRTNQNLNFHISAQTTILMYHRENTCPGIYYYQDLNFA